MMYQPINALVKEHLQPSQMCKIAVYKPYCEICGSAVTTRNDISPSIQHYPVISLIVCKLANFHATLCLSPLPSITTGWIFERLLEANTTFEQSRLALATEIKRLADDLTVHPRDHTAISATAKSVKTPKEHTRLPFQITIRLPNQGFNKPQPDITATRLDQHDPTSWEIDPGDYEGEISSHSKPTYLSEHLQGDVAVLEGLCRRYERRYAEFLRSQRLVGIIRDHSDDSRKEYDHSKPTSSANPVRRTSVYGSSVSNILSGVRSFLEEEPSPQAQALRGTRDSVSTASKQKTTFTGGRIPSYRSSHRRRYSVVKSSSTGSKAEERRSHSLRRRKTAQTRRETQS